MNLQEKEENSSESGGSLNQGLENGNGAYQAGKMLASAGKEIANTGVKEAVKAGAASAGGLPVAIADKLKDIGKVMLANDSSTFETSSEGVKVIAVIIIILLLPIIIITSSVHGLVGASVEKYHEDQYNKYSFQNGFTGVFKYISDFFQMDDEVGEYQGYEPLYEGIEKNISILDKAFTKAYEVAKIEVRNKIIEEGYDEVLTMESFENNGYPFQNINYAELISIISQSPDYNIENLKYKKFKALLNNTIYNQSLKYLYCMKVETDYKERIYYYDVKQNKIELGEGERVPEGAVAYTEKIKYGKVTLKHYDLKSVYEMIGLNPNEKNAHWDVNNIDMLDEQEKYLRYFAKECYLGPQERTIWDRGYNRTSVSISEEEYEKYEEFIQHYEGDIDEAVKKLLEAAFSTLGATYSMEKRFEKGYFDCSSLTYWCYKQIGIDIGVYYSTASKECHYLEDNGYKVSDYYDESIMKPGDLIFYSSRPSGKYKNITHTGLYVGDGKMIDASSSRKKVVYRDVWGKDEIVSVCRPLQ